MQIIIHYGYNKNLLLLKLLLKIKNLHVNKLILTLHIKFISIQNILYYLFFINNFFIISIIQ